MRATIQDSFFGLVCHTVSRGKLFPFPEEKDDFQLPKRYQRDPQTEAQLAARRERLEKQRKAKEYRDSVSKEREEKPIRIARVVPADDAQGNGELTESERQRQLADVDRSAKPIAIAAVPPEQSGPRNRRMNSHRRVDSDDTDRTRIVTPSANPEAGLDLGDEEDPNLVDWYGPDDPANPMNWRPAKKAFVTAMICLITTSVYSGSSVYSPGIMEAMQYFGVAQVPATLGLSLFVAGYGIGPLFLSPLTEIPAIGRTVPYIITLALFCVLQVPTIFVTNFAGFCVLRFLAGFFGSPPLATGGASVSDMYGEKTRPFAMGLWGLSAAAGPALGPVWGSFAVEAKGWRWSFWTMLWLSGFTLILLIFFLPETSSLNILVRRARRLRKLTGNKDLKSAGELQQADMTGKDIAIMTLWRPFELNFTQPIVFLLNLYISFIYAILYSWFEVFPIIYSETYGWSLGISGLPYLALLVGSVLGYFGYCLWHKYYWIKKYEESNGKILPEERLPPVCVAAFCYPICLFCVGWTAGRTHWSAPVIFSGFFGVGTCLAFQGILNYLTDTYVVYAASVLAANDFSRSAFGTGAPLFSHGLFVNLGVDWGCSLLGFISILFIPLPFLLYKYGHIAREKSSKAQS
ncbi:hypothetical protein NliqN6_2622 [Naganishia liquefaciens]|uniref:Major facilitator superfamily (MFS) profile domain-containing protein n=1 Tax=Naganishia liquefaciens TaxID=104408 RepID=A0A8H3TT77_9TREE|nr:hypothetical protein NliqN6_2622 [Naganishia liquefaciens]